MNYQGLQHASSALASHLGGNIRGGDPFTFCPSVWEYVINRFAVMSVLDIGSGCGDAAAWFYRKGLQVIAVEGMDENISNSLYPAIKQDLTIGPIVTKVDLVHCQEVVEHIDEKYLENLLASLATGRVVLMTHALPGQGGYHHVNEQPSDYWVNHLSRIGGSFLQEDPARIRALAKADGGVYMEQTGMVFLNSSRA